MIPEEALQELESIVSSRDELHIYKLRTESEHLHLIQITYGIYNDKGRAQSTDRDTYDINFFDINEGFRIGRIINLSKEALFGTLRGFDFELYDIARAIFSDYEIAFKIAVG